MAKETRVQRSESFPDLADEIMFPRLSDAKLEWLGERGTRKRFEAGEVLYEHGVREAPFFVIERGRVEFIDRKPGKDVHVAEADGRTFIGEPTISACVAVEPTETIAFDRGGLRDMVARWPEFGEHVFATLLARRAGHGEEGHGVMRLIAPRASRRAFEECATCWSATCCRFAGTTRRAPPCSSGWRSRARKREAWAPGGQAGTSTRIENYLGFPSGISGAAGFEPCLKPKRRPGVRGNT